MGSLFGGGKRVTVGYRYYLSVFMGLCRGPIDQIVEIKVGDRTAWPRAKGSNWKDDPITDTRNTEIRAGNLFGGDKREGGIEGRLHVYMGKDGQTLASKWRALLGGRVPGFRGVVTVWFDGLISSGNPYPKPWKIRVRRTIMGWNGAVWQKRYATIWLNDRSIKAMNPAHILYEAATNYDWGRGLKRSRLGPSWDESAKRLHKERMGLCLAYRRDGDLDEFVSNVIQYVGGTIYTDRETGLIEFKLIRNDYDRNALRLYDYSSGLLSVEEEDQTVQNEMVNEVVVKYRHTETNQDRECRVQNLASIQGQKARNVMTLDLPGAPTFNIASRIAQRELRGLSVPERYKIRMDHRAWQEYPGSVFRISAPDRGLQDVIIRAGKITYESVDSGEVIVIEGMLDVFGLPASSFVTDSGDDWADASTDPATITNYLVRELTYYDYVINADRYIVRNLSADDTALATFAVRPLPMALNYNILTRSGSAPFTGTTSEGFVASGLLVANISAYQTDVDITAILDGDSFEENMLIQIDSEMMRVNTYTYDEDTQTGTLNISRGIIDSIPAPHAAGARFFVISDIGSDTKEWLKNDVVDVKMQTVTASAEMDEADVPVQTISMNARQYKPYPPGDVRIGGNPIFAGVTAGGDEAMSLVGQPSMTLTWKHRDRISQQDVIVTHGESNVGPEVGVQYRFQITDLSNNPIVSLLVSGTTYTRSISGLASGTYYVKLAAERDGLRSGPIYTRKFVK